MAVLLQYFLAVFLSLWLCLQPANGQPWLLYGSQRLDEFEIGTHEDVGLSGNSARFIACGTDTGTGSSTARWYYPDGYEVPSSSQNGQTRTYLLERQRGYALLVRDIAKNELTCADNGVYRCEITDTNGVVRNLYIGLYCETTDMPNGVGVVSISQASPRFRLISADPLKFTLTSTTTGGPPTTAKWTLPDGTVILPQDRPSQRRVVDAVNSTVKNILTMARRLPGEYTFVTDNRRTGDEPPVSITLEAANPPTNLGAYRNGFTSIYVYWSPPASGGATRTGYRIFYETGGRRQSVDVGAYYSWHTLTYLQLGATYSISIAALSDTLPSTVVGPVEVTIEGGTPTKPMVAIREQNPTFIRVTSTHPSGPSPASYVIEYSRVTGDSQALCEDVGHNGSFNTGAPVTYISNLQEFSSYSIVVTAVFFGGTRLSTTAEWTTSRALPSGAPTSLAVRPPIRDTSFTVQWEPVECIERNGETVNYRVRFGPKGGPQAEETVDSAPRRFTASGLPPFTEYSFQVAAINSVGIGPFTDPLIVPAADTRANPPSDLMVDQTDRTSVNVSWTAPESGGAKHTSYTIFYKTSSSFGSVIVPAKATNHTLENLKCGVPYNISIVANSATNPSEEVGPEILTLVAAKPPSGLMAVQSGLTSVDVSWTAPAPGCAIRTGYLIFYKTGDVEDHVDVGAGVTSYELTGLEEDTTYSISIVALSEDFDSPEIGPVLVTLEVVNPPSDLRAVQSGPTDVTVSWTAPAPGGATHTDYRIFYETGGNEQRVEVGGDATSHNLTDLEEGEMYSISIEAFSEILTSIKETVTVKVQVVNPPSGLMAVQSGLTSITVCWTAPAPGGANRTDYLIFYRTDGSERSVHVEADATCRTLTGLDDGATYSITIRAQSEFPTLSSTVVGPVMITLGSCISPSGLMAVQSGPTSITVFWTAPAPGGAPRTGYCFVYNSGGNGDTVVDLESDATNHTLTDDLQIGATYFFTLQSNCTSLYKSIKITTEVFLAPVLRPIVTTEVLDSTSIDVNFTQPNGSLPAERYDIEWFRVTGAGQSLCRNLEHTSNDTDVQSIYNITDLEEFSNYTITVTAHFFYGFPQPEQRSTVVVEETLPDVPTDVPPNLMVRSPLRDTSITIRWGTVKCSERNGEIINYIVRFGPEDGKKKNITVQAPLRTFTGRRRSATTTYSFEVAAVNSAGVGPFSEPLIVDATLRAPHAPSGLTACQSGPTSIDVSWTAPVDAIRSGFRIMFETGGNEWTKDVRVGDTSLTLTGLEDGATYSITIVALSLPLPSVEVGPIMVTVEVANPPFNFGAYQSDRTNIIVWWSAPYPRGAMVTGYRIFNETGGSEPQSVDVGAGVTRHTLTDLQIGASYDISIVALFTSDKDFTSTLRGPEMVTVEEIWAPIVTTEVLSATSINVTFDQPRGRPADTYDIEYARVTGRGQTMCRTVEHAGIITNVASPYIITGLQEFSRYYIEVTAHFFNDVVQESTLRVPHTLTAKPTGCPLGVVARDVTDTFIALYWRQPKCIERNGELTHYDVRFGPQDGEKFIAATDSKKDREFVFKDLTPSTTYCFQVAAVNSEGRGPFCEVLNVTTLSENRDQDIIVYPPSNLMAVQSGPTSITVSWTAAPAPVGARLTGYRIDCENGGSEPDVEVGPGVTSHTLTDLEDGVTYNCSIVAFAGTEVSDEVGPETVTIESPVAPYVLTRPNTTFIVVSFIQRSGPLPARYDIEYTRVTGPGQTLCGGVADIGSDIDVQSPYTLTNLEEFSNYTITVTARFPNDVQLPTGQVEGTLPALPSAAPQDLIANGDAGPTFIRIQWRQVECIQRNGEIIHYTVRYGQGDCEDPENIVEERNTTSVARRHNATGLYPSTTYVFTVAAVNSVGQGPFACFNETTAVDPAVST